MKKFLLILCFFLFPTFLCFSQSDGSFEKIKSSYYEGGDYKKSIQSLRNLASSDSIPLVKKQRAMEFLAKSYLALGDYDKAYSTVQNIPKTGKLKIKWDPTENPRILNYAFYRSVKDNRGNYLVDSVEGDYPNYLVLGFFNEGKSNFTVFGNSLSYFVNKEIESGDELVVERERVRWIIDEFTEERLSVTSEEAYRFGRLTGVEKVVFGSYDSENVLRVKVKVLDVSEVQIEAKKEFTEDHQNSVELFEDVASFITDKELNYKEDNLQKVFKYSKALKMSFDNRYFKAEDLLVDIKKEDSEFRQSTERLKAIKPIIATYK